MKKITIYGKANCPFCEKAKNLTADLQGLHPSIKMEYIDIVEKGMDKEAITIAVGAKEMVRTVPQIVLEFEGNEKLHVGGFTEFNDYVLNKTNLLKK